MTTFLLSNWSVKQALRTIISLGIVFSPLAIETAGSLPGTIKQLSTFGPSRNWEDWRPTGYITASLETPGRSRACSSSYQCLCKSITNVVSFQNTLAALQTNYLHFSCYCCVLADRELSTPPTGGGCSPPKTFLTPPNTVPHWRC